MRTVHYGTQVLILALVMAVRSAAAEAPQLVSPTGESSACPTFSWAVIPAASGYELVVYEVTASGDVSPHPVTSVALPAGAGSWTLPADSCLAPGARYAWSLRATGGVGSAWSEAVLFAVTEAPSQDEVRQALEVLRRYQRVGTSREVEIAGSTPESVIAGSIRQPIEREKDDEHLDLFQSLSAPTTGAANPSPRTVETPSGFSLSLDGDFELGGFVFQDGTPFLHNDGGAAYGNTALGINALVSATPGSPGGAAGGLNSAVGQGALQNNTSGSQNTATGFLALFSNTEGYRNTAIGYRALDSNTTGHDNTALGTAAGFHWTTGQNNIALGRGAYGAAGESGVIRIGGQNQQNQTFIEGIINAVGGPFSTDVCIDGDQLGPCSASSVRFKQGIEPLGDLREDLSALRPVSFRYKEEFAGEENPSVHYGLIAEEVAQVFPSLVTLDEEGRPHQVRYDLLTPILLAETQRQEAELGELRRTLAEQRSRVDKLARKRRFR